MEQQKTTYAHSEPGGRCTVLTALVRSVADLLGVDTAADAVLHLNVQLGKHVNYNAKTQRV